MTKTTYQKRREDLISIRPEDPQGEPIDLASLIATDGVVVPECKAYAEHLVKTGKEGTIDCQFSVDLLIAMWKANGKNRTPTPAHVSAIGANMQSGHKGTGFEPSLTNFAITCDGWLANGGHSKSALTGAFLPPQFVLDFDLYQVNQNKMAEIDGKLEPVLDSEGEPAKEIVSKLYPFRYADEGEEGLQEVPLPMSLDDWDKLTIDEKKAEYQKILNASVEDRKRLIRVAVNAPQNIVIRFDSVQRGRYGEEALELFGPARVILDGVELFENQAKLYAAVFRQFWLAAKVEPYQKTIQHDGQEYEQTRYGTISGGGATLPITYPIIFLTIDPIMEEHFNASGLTASNGEVSNLSKAYTALKRRKKDILTALLRLDLEGATRLGELLRGKGQSKALRDICSRIERAEKDSSLRSLASPNVVQAYLIAAGNGGVPVQAIDHPTYTDIEHQTICRGRTWDRGEPNEEGEDFATVFDWSEKSVVEWYADQTGNKPKTARKPKRKTTAKKTTAKKS